MRSIKKDIVRTTTVTIVVILFSLFLTIDIVLDDWVKNKFDETLITISNYLKTLVEVNRERVEFEFSDEFMPEFDDKKEAEYFQLWIDDKPYERSNSLNEYPEEQLAKDIMTINTTKIIDVVLPDGRSGRAIMSFFHPQVPTRLRGNVPLYQHTAFLTVTVSSEKFSQALIALDIIFWLLSLTVILAMRYLVIFQIDKGLKPLISLNKEIANLRVDKSTSSLLRVDDEHIETAPIRSGLLRFIEFSQQTLQEEQRLSADIAHELKTPIAEIISLSELHIQYPNDMRITASYDKDMLNIGQRMKSIVNNLMMLNQNDEYLLKQQNKDVTLSAAITDVLETIKVTHTDVLDRVKLKGTSINTMMNLDIISFNMIMTNLINNALFYSPMGSPIICLIDRNNTGSLQITINNQLTTPITNEQLSKLFKPLYQVDTARTDNSHYGLGLAIVEKLCKINHYQINVNRIGNNMIQFILDLNKQ
jgi:signal transduction histidine kinase